MSPAMPALLKSAGRSFSPAAPFFAIFASSREPLPFFSRKGREGAKGWGDRGQRLQKRAHIPYVP